MDLQLFDTYTRSKRPFQPLEPGLVRMYSCGPTVYQYSHIGNMRTYIFTDILRRVLVYNGYQLRHVMNITDVGHLASDADEGEDKLEREARIRGRTAWELADFYTRAFRQDMARLNIQEPTIWVKATDNIPAMIELIQVLERKGYTYRTGDGIYFDTSRFPDYGHLARLDLEGLMAGARVEVREGKRNPADFALWKFSPPDVKRQMEWDSPWGIGFPGWHIECSAMAMRYLGETLDIHTGGVDHIPVHHTNEIAQSEAATGKPFARFWLHGEFLNLEEGKMAKSVGNVILVQTLIEQGFDPMNYRYLCLTAHYRAKLTFNWDNLVAARSGLENLKEHLRAWGEPTEIDVNFQERFHQEINDDLGMPRALALVWELVRSDLPGGMKAATLLDFDRIFGLRLAEARTQGPETIPAEIQALVDERTILRRERRWGDADAIRRQVAELGYEILDTPTGATVRRRRS